jgi:hypothetical protein
MWLYPLPALVALAGWIFLFVTSGVEPMLYSLLALATGAVAFMIWSRHCQSWPFAKSETQP